jgi:hypothetical protein
VSGWLAALAEDFGVSVRTLQRDGAFADAVDELKHIAPGLEEAIASGKAPARQRIVEAGSHAASDPERAAAILEGEPWERRRQIVVALDVDMINDLDMLAGDSLSRAEVVRLLLKRALADERWSHFGVAGD